MSTHICPVKIGDRFYHRKPNQTLPDRLEVLDVLELGSGFVIRAKYLYHTIGPSLERSFSDMIFQDEDWIVERKGIDF